MNKTYREFLRKREMSLAVKIANTKIKLESLERKLKMVQDELYK